MYQFVVKNLHTSDIRLVSATVNMRVRLKLGIARRIGAKFKSIYYWRRQSNIKNKLIFRRRFVILLSRV